MNVRDERISITTKADDPQGDHVRVRVFAGRAGGTRALCGILTMQAGPEVNEFIRRIEAGEGQ